MHPAQKHTSFSSFYPYYLEEHADPRNRRLHFTGTALLIICLVVALATHRYWMLILVPVLGYGFAWVGHYFIEKNKPATFTYPFYSLAGDFVMFWDMLTGNIDRKIEKHRAQHNAPNKQV